MNVHEANTLIILLTVSKAGGPVGPSTRLKPSKHWRKANAQGLPRAMRFLKASDETYCVIFLYTA